MRIIITTGLSGKDVGGPAQYGSGLKNAFQELGHEVKLISYGRTEKLLPIGARHIFFFFRILPRIFWANYVLTLDTFSTGVPSVWGAKILGKKSIVRVGGDFLWSAYINKTSKPITLPRQADFLAFNTKWQKKIWESYYEIKNCGVVRNLIPEKKEAAVPPIKNFLWAGRMIPEKNLESLRKSGVRLQDKYPDFRLDIVTGESHEKIFERIKNAYAVVSVAFSDICPNFILEGISFGKPFVMTRETGLNEIYPKGGIFFNPLKVNELERAMEAVLNYRVYHKVVEELRKNEVSHSWKDIAEEYLDIWKRI